MAPGSNYYDYYIRSCHLSRPTTLSRSADTSGRDCLHDFPDCKMASKASHNKFQRTRKTFICRLG